MPAKLRQRSRAASKRQTTAAPQAGHYPSLDLKTSLAERVKELECLYGISSLLETHPSSPQRFLQSVVDQLPRSWRYPPFACARIQAQDGTYTSEHFRTGPWRMAVDLRGDGKTMGVVEVFYRDGVPAFPDGQFLKEEHALLRVVAERIATALLHMKAEADLQEAHRLMESQNQVLQETNIALRTVLSRLEAEKRGIREAMVANIQKIIMPIVYELELAVAGRQRSYVTLLRQSLQEIASPFLSQLSNRHLDLTPVEIALCAMIRNGLSTKEIAQIRCIALGTVRRHRENIRRKLGLRNRAANLVTYLQSATPEYEQQQASIAAPRPLSEAPSASTRDRDASRMAPAAARRRG